MKPRTLSAAIGAALLILTMAAFVRAPLLPDLGREIGMSAIGLGLMGSVFALGRLLADLPAGRVADRTKPARMMAASAAIVAVGSVVMAIAGNEAWIYVSALLLGVGSTFVLTTGMSHFARAPKKRRGMAMSAFAGWLLAGQSFGPAVGGILADSFDWRWSLGAAGVAAALVAVGLWLLPVGTIATGEESTGSGEQVDEHLKNPSRQAIAFLYLLPAVQFALGGAILQTLVPIVADGELAIGPATVGLALGVGGVARLAGALVAGQVTDRVSRRWALVPSQVIQAAGVAVFAMATTRALWLVAILLMTFGSVGVHVGATILADLSEASTLGRRLGVFRFTGDAAFMVAPALSGWLYSTSGRVWATVPMLVLAVVVAAGVTLWVPETASDRT